MKSLFVTGTDTDVGKTILTGGIAAALKKMGKDVGIMKPFAAGIPEKNGYKSKDVKFLAKASQTSDPERLVNPYFFELSASPYTATNSLGVEFDVKVVLDSFKELSLTHDIMLVEGIGGAMTPILDNYFVTNLIKEMNLQSIIISSNRIGTINHTLMTCKICKDYGIKITSIIINNLNSDGYQFEIIKRDLEELTKIPVIGPIPFFEKINLDKLSNAIIKNIDLKSIFN